MVEKKPENKPPETPPNVPEAPKVPTGQAGQGEAGPKGEEGKLPYSTFDQFMEKKKFTDPNAVVKSYGELEQKKTELANEKKELEQRVSELEAIAPAKTEEAPKPQTDLAQLGEQFVSDLLSPGKTFQALDTYFSIREQGQKLLERQKDKEMQTQITKALKDPEHYPDFKDLQGDISGILTELSDVLETKEHVHERAVEICYALARDKRKAKSEGREEGTEITPAHVEGAGGAGPKTPIDYHGMSLEQLEQIIPKESE